MIVGIDLGTTNSLVAVWRDGKPELIPNALGEVLTPSCVSVDKDGSVLVGRAARERAQTHPESATGLASGLLKMATVGLGKQRGAQEAHSHGLWDSIREVPKLQLAKSKILFGVAMVDVGHDVTTDETRHDVVQRDGAQTNVNHDRLTDRVSRFTRAP